MMLTDLADVLRAAGLRVVEVPGWKTRGYLGQQMSGAKSVLCHWTGTNPAAAGDYPTLNTILNGNANTPGPLSQTGLGRDGTWYVIAAGLCNHAGTVDRWECSNPNSIGVEAEYHPDQGAWPDVQQRSYERGCAALRAHYDIPLELVRGHYEAATPYGRKPDPNTLPGGMPGFRQRVAAVNLEEDDMTPDEVYRAVWERPIDVVHGDGTTHKANTGDVLRYSELHHNITWGRINDLSKAVVALGKTLGAQITALGIELGDDEQKLLDAIAELPDGAPGGGPSPAQIVAALREVFADAGDDSDTDNTDSAKAATS